MLPVFEIFNVSCFSHHFQDVKRRYKSSELYKLSELQPFLSLYPVNFIDNAQTFRPARCVLASPAEFMLPGDFKVHAREYKYWHFHNTAFTIAALFDLKAELDGDYVDFY